MSHFSLFDSYTLAIFDNVAMDVIKMGYHWTLKELFSLVHHQNEIRERAGKDTVIYNAPQIRNDPRKLFFLRDCLIDVEDSMRKFSYQDVYINYLELLAFFSVDPNDVWIVERFSKELIVKLTDFSKAFKHRGDEKNLSMVIILLNCSFFLRAEFLMRIKHNLEALNNLKRINLDDPVAKSWNVALLPIFSEDKHLLKHHNSEENFERAVQIKTALTLIALSEELRKQPPTNEAIKQQFEYLKESLRLATEAEDRSLIAKCKHSIGMVHEANKRVDISLLYEREFYEIAQEINKPDTLIEASLSLANALAKQKSIDEAETLFTQALELLSKGGSEKTADHCRALLQVGEFFANRVGNHVRASELFQEAFKLSSAGLSEEMLSLNKQARVWCGISRANSLNAHTSLVLLAANQNRTFLEPLLNWKDKRTPIDPAICDQISPHSLNKPC